MYSRSNTQIKQKKKKSLICHMYPQLTLLFEISLPNAEITAMCHYWPSSLLENIKLS